MASKTLFITGASSGIGAETARAAVRNGWNVGLFARSQDKLDALVEELGDKANEEISRLKAEVDRLMHLASERSRGAVAAAEHKIEERPLTSVLVAFGVGLVIGKLIDRR